jgi:hypothetical protein
MKELAGGTITIVPPALYGIPPGFELLKGERYFP